MEKNSIAIKSAIKIETLTKIYRRSHLGRLHTTTGVKNLSLEVKTGEIFGLVGLNGSGKTTTIKLILGLLFPTDGKITVFGNPMPDRKKLHLIGYLPELPYFHKKFTGKELLVFYSKLSGMDRGLIPGRIQEIAGLLEMVPYMDKRISDYSKGMMQRLAIAQSLVHDPPLLVFDELVSGLDPLGIREMRTLVQKLKERGKTVFFSSHLISEVERVCDRVGILHGGSLVRVVEQTDWQRTNLEDIFISEVKK
ncbi:MAG: ABC transporter ATP-binding protein [Elusimicrobia bacterium]|nr:ABC transporter ATP-binding protein [Elusimicrobiota bacterium]